MNIDEFLDREFSDVTSEAGSDGKHEKASHSTAFKEPLKSLPLFEHVKSYLSKGNLDSAEQAYIQLWRILLQQNVKWNQEIYGQLSILNREFSKALSYASNEVKIKTNQINALISRTRDSLQEGNKGLCFKLYSEIEEINKSIPNVFFEEKKLLRDQIIELYKELRNITDSDLIKKVITLVKETNQLIDNANISIKANNMQNALANYNRCVELYNQIPQGFLRYKSSIGIGVLEIYKTISIYIEISNLQNQLSSLGKII